MEDTTAINPSPSKVTQIASNSSPHLEVETTRVTALAKNWAATTVEKETQEALPTVRHTVVIPKQKRPRKVLTLKLLVTWRNVTIPCHFSDQLTPAILLEDIGNSPWATLGSLLKVILTPPNCQMGEVHLSLQGIGQGDTLTMLVRYVKVYDPHDVQHFCSIPRRRHNATFPHDTFRNYYHPSPDRMHHFLWRSPSGPYKPVPRMQFTT